MEYNGMEEDELRARYTLPYSFKVDNEGLQHIAVSFVPELGGWFIEDKRTSRWYAGLENFADTMLEVWHWHTNEELQKRAAGIRGLN
jgi:hypothetical protein